MAFEYNSTTDAGRVRLIIGDTTASDYKFEDAEITAFLALTATPSGENIIAKAAAMALRAWAGDLIRETGMVKSVEATSDTRHRAEQMLKTAAALEQAEIDRPYGADAEVAQTDFVSALIQANADLRRS